MWKPCRNRLEFFFKEAYLLQRHPDLCETVVAELDKSHQGVCKSWLPTRSSGLDGEKWPANWHASQGKTSPRSSSCSSRDRRERFRAGPRKRAKKKKKPAREYWENIVLANYVGSDLEHLSPAQTLQEACRVLFLIRLFFLGGGGGGGEEGLRRIEKIIH